jgi:uncharacterized protein YjbI with pentapeptide repeats
MDPEIKSLDVVSSSVQQKYSTTHNQSYDNTKPISIANLPYNYTKDNLRGSIKPYRPFDQIVKGNIKITKIKTKKIQSKNLNYNYKIIFRKFGKILVYQTWDKEDSVKIYFPKGEHNNTQTLREDLINNENAADVLDLTINDDRIVNVEDFKLWITKVFYKKKNKQPFQPTTVMEIGNKKFVFVIMNAEINHLGKVVFFVSTKEIQPVSKKCNMKKMVKLPRGHFKNVRFDIDSYFTDIDSTTLLDSDGIYQYSCPPSYFINGKTSSYIIGCSPDVWLLNYLVGQGAGLPVSCFVGRPTGTVYNSIVGSTDAGNEFAYLTSVTSDTLCPCGITVISDTYMAIYGKTLNFNYGNTATCNQINSCTNGNQCNQVNVYDVSAYNSTNQNTVTYAVPPIVKFDSSATYTQYNMSGWDLSNADFTNCNLDGIQFSNATFSTSTTSTTFTGASLSGAKFYYSNENNGQTTTLRTNLTGVDFSDIDNSGGGLKNADFRQATLVNVNFTNANLSGANFSGPGDGTGIGGANLTGANFTNANLTGANVGAANFTNAILTGADLSGVQFNNGVNLLGITSGNITNGPSSLPFGPDIIGNYIFLNGYIVGYGANLTNANLNGLDLTKVALNDTILKGVSSGNIFGGPIAPNSGLPEFYSVNYGYILGPGVNLSGVDLSGLDLSNLNLTGVNLENAIMYGTNITNTNLSNANFKGLLLTPSKPLIGSPALSSGYQCINGILIGKGIYIYNESFNGYADFSNSDFSNIEIGYTTFNGIDFSNSNFSYSTILNTSFTNCIFSGVNITGTDFESGALIGVQITSQLIGTPATMPSYTYGTINGNLVLNNGYLIGPYMNLSGANLSGMNLSNLNMYNVNITGANMTGVKSGGITGPLIMSPTWQLTNSGYLLCPGSDLSNFATELQNIVTATGVDLTGANFENSMLYRTQFDNSIFTNANLNNVIIDACSFIGVNFTNATLTNINYNYIEELQTIYFRNAILTGANVTGSNFYNISFQGNSGPVIGGNDSTTYPPDIACVNGYIMSSVNYIYTYNDPNLSGAIMNNIGNLTSYNITYANLTGCDFSNYDISNLNLEYATFTGVISGGTYGQNYTLPTDWSLINGYLVGPGANLTNVNFSNNQNLSGVNLTGAILSGANFTGANLSGANLTGAILNTGSTSATYLTSIFNTTNLSGAILSGVLLNGAAWTLFNFENVNFNNATFTSDTDLSSATFNGSYGTGIIGTPQFTNGYGIGIINGCLLGPYVNLVGATFKNSPNLSGINLTGANFTNSESDGTVIPANLIQGLSNPPMPIFPENYTIVQGFVLGPGIESNGNMILNNVTFSQLYNNIVSLNNVILSSAEFYNLDFTLPSSNFTIRNANLYDMSLFNSNLTNVDFTGSSMGNMLFQGTTFTGVNFSNVTFNDNLIFNNVNLDGVNFAGATFSEGVYFAGSANITGTPINFPPPGWIIENGTIIAATSAT